MHIGNFFLPKSYSAVQTLKPRGHARFGFIKSDFDIFTQISITFKNSATGWELRRAFTFFPKCNELSTRLTSFTGRSAILTLTLLCKLPCRAQRGISLLLIMEKEAKGAEIKSSIHVLCFWIHHCIIMAECFPAGFPFPSDAHLLVIPSIVKHLSDERGVWLSEAPLFATQLDFFCLFFILSAGIQHLTPPCLLSAHLSWAVSCGLEMHLHLHLYLLWPLLAWLDFMQGLKGQEPLSC